MRLVLRGGVERSQREEGKLRGTVGSRLKPYTVLICCPANLSKKCREDYYTEHVYARDAADAGEQARRQAFQVRSRAERDDFLVVAVFKGHLREAD